MNYAGHEKLRADVAEVNTMCDLRARLNDMEHRCRFDSDVLVERLTRQTLYRANRLFMGRIPKFWNWIPASKIEEGRGNVPEHAKRCRKLAAKYSGDTPLMLRYLVPGRNSRPSLTEWILP